MSNPFAQVIIDFIALLGKNPSLYAIATILRGPDEDDYNTDHTIKSFTTARIRGFLYSKVLGTCPSGATWPEPLTPTQMATRDAFLSKCSRRYYAHYMNAVLVIKEVFGYDLITETDLNAPKVAKVNKEEAKKVFSVLDIIWKNDAIYQLIVALRSADTQAGSKNLSTCRLREFLNAQMTGSGFGIPLSAEQMKQRDAAMAQESVHYRNYWNAACKTVALVFGYDLQNEKIIA
jgi:hypothetical protein